MSAGIRIQFEVTRISYDNNSGNSQRVQLDLRSKKNSLCKGTVEFTIAEWRNFGIGIDRTIVENTLVITIAPTEGVLQPVVHPIEILSLQKINDLAEQSVSGYIRFVSEQKRYEPMFASDPETPACIEITAPLTEEQYDLIWQDFGRNAYARISVAKPD